MNISKDQTYKMDGQQRHKDEKASRFDIPSKMTENIMGVKMKRHGLSDHRSKSRRNENDA